MEGEPSVEQAEIESEAALLPEAKEAAERQFKRSRQGIHPGREPLPAHLPRVEQMIACSPEACHCGQCGRENKVIGYERTEVLDVEPAKYFVRVLLREKRACPSCEEMGVATAAMPVRIVEKGKLSDAVVVDSLVRKYGEHTPLYRQLVGLEREAGVILSPATFNAGVMRCGELLLPVIGAMREELLGGGYIQADETPVGVRSDLKKGRNHQGYIFEYSRPKADVFYDFQMSRGRAGPEGVLKEFKGVLQTDGYTGYDQVGSKGGIAHAACWAHVRRKFHEAHLIAKSDPLPREIIESIAALYAIEARAREECMDETARLELRQEQSVPLASAIKERLVEIRAAVLPKSALGKACSYALGLWPRLEVFLREGRVEIDNNWCENGMRPLALGRKNWLHNAIRRTQLNYVTYLPNDNSREYKAWMQDPCNMFRSAVYLFDSQTMYERWQYDMTDVQAQDGNLPNVAPGPVYDAYNSAWWGGSAVWLPWHWYLYYGDGSLLVESYPAMKRYVDFLAMQSPSGIQDWGLSDWYSFRDAGRPVVNTPAALLFAYVVSQTAAMMGRADEARHYAELSDKIKKAFNAGYLDTKRGVYGKPRKRNEGPSLATTQYKGAQIKDPDDLIPLEERMCTQGGQVLPLMLGVVPNEHRQKVEDALRAQIKADGNLLTTGFVGTPYLLAWLGENAPETGWALTTTHEFPSWYRMSVGSDSDQMMETWDGGMVVMPSLGGNLGAWNMETLAGIQPDPTGPGFKKIIIKPNVVGDLHWAEGWYDSVRGRIESKWRKRGGQVQLNVTIPANCSATVYMPARSVGAVTESGNSVKKAGGIRFLRMEKAYAVFEVGSGTYWFEAK